jgi:nitrate/nitrite transporter NarK
MKLAIALTLFVLCLLFAYLAGLASNNRHYPAAIIFAVISLFTGIAAGATFQRLLQ